MRFILAVDESDWPKDWPLLTGGRCSEVVVKAGLTVVPIKICLFLVSPDLEYRPSKLYWKV